MRRCSTVGARRVAHVAPSTYHGLYEGGLSLDIRLPIAWIPRGELALQGSVCIPERGIGAEGVAEAEVALPVPPKVAE